jgi:hypothetical protein
MNILSTILLVLFHFGGNDLKNTTSQEVLQGMYKRYHGTWHKALTFNQTTEQ